MPETSRVLFIGSKKFGLSVLAEMYAANPGVLVAVMTIDDRQDSRTVYDELLGFCKEHDLDCFTAANRRESEKFILGLKPDLCIVAGWYWLVSDEAIAAVPRGFIGLHNSLLPKFRGGSPLVWSLLANENQVGCSFFSLSKGMDEGPIWARAVVDVQADEYIGVVQQKLEDETLKVFRKHYPLILNNELQPEEQDHSQATYCSQRFPGDGLIDWNLPAASVLRSIRAQSDPYPGAFSYLGGHQMRIWKARLFERPYYGVAGQVAQLLETEVVVICGDNKAIMLEEVESQGQRVSPRHFIKSIKDRFSSNGKDSQIGDN